MFLLLYGFIRIEFWIITGIAMLLFKILYALKIYRTKKVLKEVEELE
jgi:Ca2+/Na+ antiporter